jgi:hypothetical protein
MTIDWTKPIEDVNGNPARVLSDDFRSARCSSRVLHTLRIVQVEFEFRSELWYVDDDGSNPGGGKLIRNKRQKVMRWLNLYALAPGVQYFSDLYEAERAGRVTNTTTHNKYLKTILVEWEE